MRVRIESFAAFWIWKKGIRARKPNSDEKLLLEILWQGPHSARLMSINDFVGIHVSVIVMWLGLFSSHCLIFLLTCHFDFLKLRDFRQLYVKKLVDCKCVSHLSLHVHFPGCYSTSPSWLKCFSLLNFNIASFSKFLARFIVARFTTQNCLRSRTKTKDDWNGNQ